MVFKFMEPYKFSWALVEKIIIQKDSCTPRSIAAPFIIAKTWKQPKCPSTEEQTRKMW